MSETESFTCKIWIAGDHREAVNIVKKWCDDHGDCYAVSKTDFIYSGGSEKGVCVTRINYARFPENEKGILARVRMLGELLAGSLFQKSFSIETPDTTFFIEREVPCKKEKS